MHCLIIMVLLITCSSGDSDSQNNSVIIRTLLKEHNVLENFFISPLSIDITLSILQAIENDIKQVPHHLLIDVNTFNNDEFFIRNKFFVKQQYSHYDYLRRVIKYLPYTEIEAIDYKNKLTSANIINKWATDNSKGKIKNLMNPNDINVLIKVILINIIYFKIDWNYKFDKSLTRKDDFYLDDKNYVSTDMMRIENKFEYDHLPNLHCDILKIPYKNSNYNFTVVIPKEGKQLIDLQENILQNLHHLIDFRTTKRKIELTMPKFKFQKKVYVKKLLDKLLTNSHHNKDVIDKKFVDDIVHEAYIEVNEDGVEAVAATGGIKRRTLKKLYTEVNLNKPFAFLITGNLNNVPVLLFYGNVMNPTDT